MDGAVTKSEFARLKGWKPSYVTQLKKEGRLVLDARGNVRVEETEALLARTGAGTHQHVAARFAEHRARKSSGLSVNADPPPAIPAEEGGRLAIRKLREIVAREMRLLELGLLKGDLVERGLVNHQWHDLGVALRANLDAMTERLAPRIAGAETRESLAIVLALALRDERRRARRELIAAARRIGARPS